ncbi:hypothetical protein LT493_39635 [Streptomyces tricolor]|nr:hypothetical protein [Streptomyces tricolor]
MVWYENKLLVTTEAGGADALYRYDLDCIQRTTVDGPAIGRVPGGCPPTATAMRRSAIGS